MTWQIFLIFYLLLGTATYLWRRQLAKTFTRANRLVNAFFFVAVLYPVGLLVALFSSPDMSIGWTNFFLLLLGGAIFPISNLFAYRANRHLDAGLFTVISDLTPVVSITAGTILLNETLNGPQWIGAAVILMAALLVTVPQLRHHRHMVDSGGALVDAFVAVTLLGLGFVFERYMLTQMDFGAYLVYGWGTQMIWSVIMAWPERKSTKILRDKKIRLPLLGYSLSATLRGLCFVAALTLSGNVSLVAASISFLTVLVVLAAYFILQEKEGLPLKLGSAALGFGGLLLLNLT